MSSVSSASTGSNRSHIHQQIGGGNNNINISESLNDASTSMIPDRHQQMQQIQVHEWQPDEAVDACTICGKKFTIWIRKHHCRKCGRIVCNSCSMNKITYLPSTYVVCPPSQIFLESPHVPHRTCDPCYEEVEMIRSALSESIHQVGELPQLPYPGMSTENSSVKDLSVSRTVEVPNLASNSNNIQEAEENSFKDRCPVCNKFIGCYAEQQKEEHINDCLINLEFSGSPKQQRTNNRMLVYTIPKISPNSSSSVMIPSIDNTLNDASFHDSGARVLSTSMDTLTSRGAITSDQLMEPLSSSAKSATSTLQTADEEKNDNECVICFEEFEPGDKVARMECLCVFHYRCIKDWFQRKGERECPVHTTHYQE